MNIIEHSIYKDIYDLCGEIEKLPASEQATKVVTMASDLEKPAARLIEALKDIKLTALTTTNASDGLMHIIRLCIDAGIVHKLPDLQRLKAESQNKPS